MPTTLSQEAPFGGTAFDGQYYSPEFKYGFKLNDGTGTATASNSPRYRVGDVILRYRVIEQGKAFIGQQMCSDGGFHPVMGKRLTDDAVRMNSPECGPQGPIQWTMALVPGTGRTVAAQATRRPPAATDALLSAGMTQEGAQPFVGLQAALAKCRTPSKDDPSDMVISTCTEAIQELSKRYDPLPSGAFDLFRRRAWAYMKLEDMNRALADANEAVYLNPNSDTSRYIRARINLKLERSDQVILDSNAMIEQVDPSGTINFNDPNPPMTEWGKFAAKGVYLQFRGEAYAQKGQYRLALDDFNVARRLNSALTDIAAEIRQAEQKLAESDLQTAPHRSQGAYTFICHSGDDPNPKILTVDSQRNIIRLEQTTQETRQLCVEEFRNGVFGPVNVGETASYCSMFSGNPNVRQSVTIDSHGAIATASGARTGSIRMDFGAGLLRVGDGGIAECRRAHS